MSDAEYWSQMMKFWGFPITVFVLAGLVSLMNGLIQDAQLKEKRKLENESDYQIGERVILTEPDETYSIGTIEDIRTTASLTTIYLRLEESTHYPPGTFENHLYHAPIQRLRKIETP